MRRFLLPNVMQREHPCSRTTRDNWAHALAPPTAGGSSLTQGGVFEMKFIKTLSVSLLGASSFLAMMAVTATPASAQAARTWVSGVGDDVNPCSRTASCKTFAGAI